MESYPTFMRCELTWTRSEEARLGYTCRSVDQKWRRLIPSRFPPVSIYERLGSPELVRAALDSENRTNPRLQSREWLTKGAAGLDRRSPRLQNWNHAPFAYKNPEGSSFLEAAYGALEVADSVEAALAIAIRRREIFMSRTNEPATDLDMRMLVTQISGEFADLTDLPLNLPREERWKIGRDIYEDERSGILFRRPERPDAILLSVFDSSVLGSTEQSAHYRFVWDGKVIRDVYDFTPPGKTISRATLLPGDDGRQAA